MQSIPKDAILEFHPDTFLSIRREYNLDKPGRMEDAIRIFREWIEKQAHLKKKDFSDHYLETAIILCKGSLERAKKQLDRMCTFRTMLPQYFGCINVKKEFQELLDAVDTTFLPKLTPDHYRVFFVRINESASKLSGDKIEDWVRFTIVLSEYLRVHDYCRGFCIVLDYTNINFMDVIPFLRVDIQNLITMGIEGYGMRVKGIHIFSSSKLVSTLINCMKQVVSPKIGSRIHSHSSVDVLPDILPLDILPKDYGGKDILLTDMHTKWVDILSSEEHINQLRDINEACTEESLRQSGDVNDQFASLPGTFRTLNVD